MRNMHIKVVGLAGALSLGLSAQADQLKNGKFEKPVASNMGNNVGTSPNHWSVSGGTANLARVDGAGPHDNSSAGPEQDGNGNATAENPRQYLDIAGDGTAYQSFTASCSGNVKVSGALSPRSTGGGAGTISLRAGGANGTVIASSGSVNVPAKSGESYSWTPVKFWTDVVKGNQYTYTADLANNLNLDNAAVTCPKRSGKGMTFGIRDPYETNPEYPHPVTGTIAVGCTDKDGGKCDPIKGDTPCATELPILCISMMSLPKPASIKSSSHNQKWTNWSGGVVGTTPATAAPGSLSEANAMCTAEFGEGWRVAQFHDALNTRGGFGFQAYGNVGTVFNRFWADIDDQKNGVCWDRSK